MTQTRLWFLAMATIIALLGCEDVITLDLKKSAPQLVVVGHLTNESTGSYFVLTRTTDFYQPTTPEPVSGASIIVRSGTGATDTLTEAGGAPGHYVFHTLLAQPGERYTATVVADGITAIATTACHPRIAIDSLATIYQPGGGIGVEEKKGYRLHVHFHDSVNLADYALLGLYRNGERPQNIFLYDGRYSDGNAVDYEYFDDIYQLGDTIRVELSAFNHDLYDYYITLTEVIATEDGGNGFGDVSPANPNTNWSGGALGYFGVMTVSRGVIVAR